MSNQDTKPPQIKFEDTLDYQEQKASKQNLPELKEHLIYLDKVYMFCFGALQSLNTKRYGEISKQLRCQTMILMRITDFLRSIRFLVINGYPEQACTLTSSIFELAHTAVYFLHNPEAVDKWFGCKDTKATMPKLIGIENYKELVKKNYANKGLEELADSEYEIYKQLCWTKHSHPVMQAVVLKDNKVQTRIGPYTDETSINHAWFSIQHSGRLTELVIESLVDLKDQTFIQEKLKVLYKMRTELSNKAIKRFGNEDPFKEW